MALNRDTYGELDGLLENRDDNGIDESIDFYLSRFDLAARLKLYFALVGEVTIELDGDGFSRITSIVDDLSLNDWLDNTLGASPDECIRVGTDVHALVVYSWIDALDHTSQGDNLVAGIGAEAGDLDAQAEEIMSDFARQALTRPGSTDVDAMETITRRYLQDICLEDLEDGAVDLDDRERGWCAVFVF